VVKIFDRVVKAASGAAIGTETTVDYEIIGGTHDLLINKALAEDMQLNLQKVGGVNLTAAEIDFGKKLQSTFNYVAPAIETAADVAPQQTWAMLVMLYQLWGWRQQPGYLARRRTAGRQ
jgi:aminobenzoyl-glutamate utilization protein B